jgi:hypothetical protein
MTEGLNNRYLLLDNGTVNKLLCHRRSRHSYTTYKQATTEETLETAFSILSDPRLYNANQQDKAKPDIENIRGLNLATVKLTTVQVTKLSV